MNYKALLTVILIGPYLNLNGNYEGIISLWWRGRIFKQARRSGDNPSIVNYKLNYWCDHIVLNFTDLKTFNLRNYYNVKTKNINGVEFYSFRVGSTYRYFITDLF